MSDLLLCPFCGSEPLELDCGLYSCMDDDCAGAEIACTASQWNTRYTPNGWHIRGDEQPHGPPVATRGY